MAPSSPAFSRRSQIASRNKPERPLADARNDSEQSQAHLCNSEHFGHLYWQATRLSLRKCLARCFAGGQLVSRIRFTVHRFDEVLAVAEQKGLQPKRLRYFGDERRCGGPRQTYISHLKPNINGRSGISPVDHPWLL